MTDDDPTHPINFELTGAYAFTPPPSGTMFFPKQHPRWWEGWRASYGKEPAPPKRLYWRCTGSCA